MEWRDIGVCVQLRRLGETKVCGAFFTQNHGVHRGVLRQSRKQPMQVGTRCELTWKARLSEHMGTWTHVEMTDNAIVHILGSPLKALALASAGELAAKLMPERQEHAHTFESYICFLDSLTAGDWLDAYANYELQILKDIGYGMDWSQCAVTKTRENLVYVSPVTGNAACRSAGVAYADKLLMLPQTCEKRLYVYAQLLMRHFGVYFRKADLPFVRSSLQEQLKGHC